MVAEVEEVYRAWPSVWRRYGTEHALEVELGNFLVKTRAGLYAIYGKDWPFQPFVRDQESRDLLHEAAAHAAAWLAAQRKRFGASLMLAIGGPRESEAPGIYMRAKVLIEALLAH